MSLYTYSYFRNFKDCTITNEQKNIVVVGYPKSGTHWISRLVAELVHCPMMGNWGFLDQNYEEKEGLHRKSNYQCSKSHHPCRQILEVNKEPIYKIICVIRDPRDIVISGSHYFDSAPKHIKSIERKLGQKSFFGKSLRMFSNLFLGKRATKKRMIKAVLYGNAKLNEWTGISWKAFYSEYRKQDNVIFVKYENMIDTPLTECLRILNYLEIERTEKQIMTSFDTQSFVKRKKKSGHNQKLLRKGQYGYWKSEFSTNEKKLFFNLLKKELTLFDYEL